MKNKSKDQHENGHSKMDQNSRPKEYLGCNFVIAIFRVFLGWTMIFVYLSFCYLLLCWECPKNERHFDVFHYIILN